MYLTNATLDEFGESYIAKYYREYPSNSLCVDIDGFAEYLGLPVIYEEFGEEELDKIGFLSNGDTSVSVIRGGSKMKVVFPANTIILDSSLQQPSMSGRRRFTIAHEIGHYLINSCFQKKQQSKL